MKLQEGNNLKEKCHEGLARLVAQQTGESKANIETLARAAIEPDVANKDTMRQDFLKVLPVSIKWLIDHTVRAKDLATQCLSIARQKIQAGDSSGYRILGWSWHYITDWATPYHSPTARVNPIPEFGLIGALAGAILGGVSRSKDGRRGNIKGALKGAVIGGGISAGVGAIDLAVNHSQFEQKIDAYWESNQQEIREMFEASTNNIKSRLDSMSPNAISKMLGDFLDELRNMANNYPKENTDKVDLTDYLARIAVVLFVSYYNVIK